MGARPALSKAGEVTNTAMLSFLMAREGRPDQVVRMAGEYGRPRWPPSLRLATPGQPQFASLPP
jgi:hypothetical protein